MAESSALGWCYHGATTSMWSGDGLLRFAFGQLVDLGLDDGWMRIVRWLPVKGDEKLAIRSRAELGGHTAVNPPTVM
jgi:hypothetical protein